MRTKRLRDGKGAMGRWVEQSAKRGARFGGVDDRSWNLRGKQSEIERERESGGEQQWRTLCSIWIQIVVITKGKQKGLGMWIVGEATEGWKREKKRKKGLKYLKGEVEMEITERKKKQLRQRSSLRSDNAKGSALRSGLKCESRLVRNGKSKKQKHIQW